MEASGFRLTTGHLHQYVLENIANLHLDACFHTTYRSSCQFPLPEYTHDRHMVLAGVLRGHTKAILCLAVVTDLICSGSADRTVRIWRRGTNKRYSCLAVLEGHRRPVKCLMTSSTESGTTYTVCSGSLDYDIKVWQVSAPAF